MADQQSEPSSISGAATSRDELSHIVSVPTMLIVFALLIGLTIATVTAATLGLGRWEIWVTLGIATVKGSLVAAYFMHLRYDKPFNALIFAVALAVATLFLAFTLLDTKQYQPDIDLYSSETVNP